MTQILRFPLKKSSSPFFKFVFISVNFSFVRCLKSLLFRFNFNTASFIVLRRRTVTSGSDFDNSASFFCRYYANSSLFYRAAAIIRFSSYLSYSSFSWFCLMTSYLLLISSFISSCDATSPLSHGC